MMEILRYDLQARHGGSYSRTFVWKERTPLPSPPGYSDTPKDLTGYEAVLQVRAAYQLPVLLQLTVGAGIEINAGAGSIAVAFTADQINTLPVQRLVYSLLLKNGSNTLVFAEGYLNLFAGAGTWPLP